MKIVTTAIFAFLLLTLVAGPFFFYRAVSQPKDSKNPQTILFSVEKGQDLWDISANLEQEGLVTNKWLIRTYVLLRRKSENLRAGKYELTSGLNPREIAEKIIRGETMKIKITLTEGLTLQEIEEKINQQLAVQHQQAPIQISDYRIASFQRDYEFLQQAPVNLSLEGFLFPDTYFFELTMSEEKIIKMFLDNFDQKLTPELKQEITKQGKSIFDIITMASMLEKEVRTLEEKKIVSGILWKRLLARMPLQVDATVNYLTGKNVSRVSLADTQIDSSYNTYQYLGLPEGPIANPGLESIRAAVDPEESDYWYYLSTPEGKTIFSRSFEEHSLAKAKYWQ